MTEQSAAARKAIGKHLVDFGLGHWVVLICGLAILGSVFVRWMGYSDHGVFVRASGLDIARGFGTYPEAFLIPFAGLALALGAVADYLMGKPESMRGFSKPKMALVASLISLALTIEVGLRYDASVRSALGISFVNNAGIGWYTALVASVLVLTMAIMAIMRSGWREMRAPKVSQMPPPVETRKDEGEGDLVIITEPASEPSPTVPQSPPQEEVHIPLGSPAPERPAETPPSLHPIDLTEDLDTALLWPGPEESKEPEKKVSKKPEAK